MGPESDDADGFGEQGTTEPDARAVDTEAQPSPGRFGTLESPSVPPPPAPPTSAPRVVATGSAARPAIEAPTTPRPRRRLLGLSISVAVLAMLGGGAVALGIFAATLGGDDGAAPTAPPPTTNAPVASTGTLNVVVYPGDVTIIVDDLPPHVGAPWSLELAPGKHRVELRRDGYDTSMAEVDVVAGRIQTVQLSMVEEQPAQALATLTLNSQPQGLDVILDGEKLDRTTPIRMGIAPGRHEIEVRAGGEVIWRETFVARPNQNHRFRAVQPGHETDAAPAVEPEPMSPPVDAAIAPDAAQ
jgi:hypothetical protein